MKTQDHGRNGWDEGQRGAFLIIAAVFLLIVLSFLAVVFLTTFTTSTSTSLNELQSGQALYIAEGGLERAVYRLKSGTSCNPAYAVNLDETNVLLGRGDFDIVGTNHTLSTTLSAGISNLVVVIPVSSSANFAPMGRIMIESELIDYHGISGNTLINAVRGVAGTTAAAHAINTPTAQDQCRIKSTGNPLSSPVQRVVERNLQNPGAMIVYAKGAGINIPYFRRWDGTRWGPERQATALGAGVTIQFMVIIFSRTRNEAILGTLDNSGAIRVQIWNGNTNAWGATRLLANVGAGADSEYRSFDMGYETSGDRAVVVYKDANGSADPDYVIWDGTNWSAATDINIPTTGEVRWIELAPNPLSSEIVMITIDSNIDVKGMRWPGGGAAGAAWSEMGASVGVAWDTSAADSGSPAMAPSKVIDIAYEQLSGRAMFIWGDTTATDNYYRIWDGAALSAANILLDIPAMGDEADWVRLVPRPNSNQLMYGVQDGKRDLNTALWSGAVWTVHGEHDRNTEDEDHRNFDIVYETNPANAGQAWLMWGSRISTDLSRRRLWDGAAWSAITNFGDDAAYVQLTAHPASGVVFAGIYQDTSSASDDITALSFTGGAWSAETVIWGGPTLADPVLERIVIACERYIPNILWREVVK